MHLETRSDGSSQVLHSIHLGEEEEEEDLFVFNDTIEGPRAPAVKGVRALRDLYRRDIIKGKSYQGGGTRSTSKAPGLRANAPPYHVCSDGHATEEDLRPPVRTVTKDVYRGTRTSASVWLQVP